MCDWVGVSEIGARQQWEHLRPRLLELLEVNSCSMWAASNVSSPLHGWHDEASDDPDDWFWLKTYLSRRLHALDRELN